ncbi:hypothetical protein KQI65_16685 [bacterium]|nr:hypothetical protein [bacterium]
MRNDAGAAGRERRAAWFIAAAMLVAIVYIVSQGGLLKDILGGSESVEQEMPPYHRGQFRRAVMLPLNFMEKEATERNRATAQMKEYGINWLEVPLPVWQATSRNLEYNSFDLRATTDMIHNLREQDFGITLVPLYWNGDTLSTAPQGELGAAFLQSYRVLLLDLAGHATTSGADAILLDALFGEPSVSATEWLALITDMRKLYAGSLEIRLDSAATPEMYLRHFDGAHIAPDSLRLIAIREDAPDKPIYLRNPLRDRYASGLFPWDPVNANLHHDLHILTRILDLTESMSTGGFTLAGLSAYTNCSVDRTPLGALLKSHHRRSLQHQLEQRQQSLSSTPE